MLRLVNSKLASSTTAATSATPTALRLASASPSFSTAPPRMAPTPPTPSPPPAKAEGRRKASGFRYWLDVQTRWIDNDQYGHINNAVYYLAADAAINAYLVSHCGLQPYRQPTDPPPPDPRADVLGLMISTSAIYYAPATFPCLLRVGMRVIKLGSSSVTYELGMWELPDPTTGQPLPIAGVGGMIQAPSAPALDGEALAGTLTRATHVYVDRKNRRPVRPMPEGIGRGLQALRVEAWAEDGEGEKAKL